jgi:salicylate hydroxylase
MLQHVDSILEWRLYTHESIGHWVHDSARFCLIGDSAHAMTPYLAQGAAMGIEDAAVLGGILEAFPNKEDLATSLKMYEKLRIERTSMVAAASIDSRWFTQMEDGPEQQKRDEYMLSHPGILPGHINIRARKEFLDKLFGYDAYAALEEALEARRGGRV